MGMVLAMRATLAQARTNKIPWMGGCTRAQCPQTRFRSGTLLHLANAKVLRMRHSFFLGDDPMKYKPIAFAAAALAAGLAAAPASADLVPLGPTELTGQGIGNTFTVLTLQATGASTTESGFIDFAGGTFGDALTGSSQSRTFNFGDLGLTDAGDLALIVNLAEPGSESPPAVNAVDAGSIDALASRISLTFYTSGGTALQTFSLASDLLLEQVASGLGGSGLVFGLDDAQATALNALIAGNPGYILATGATFANAEGGPETIAAVRLEPVVAIPEPETYALMLAGIGALGFVARRRRDRS
jgi:hypothetical protein